MPAPRRDIAENRARSSSAKGCSLKCLRQAGLVARDAPPDKDRANAGAGQVGQPRAATVRCSSPDGKQRPRRERGEQSLPPAKQAAERASSLTPGVPTTVLARPPRCPPANASRDPRRRAARRWRRRRPTENGERVIMSGTAVCTASRGASRRYRQRSRRHPRRRGCRRTPPRPCAGSAARAWPARATHRSGRGVMEPPPAETRLAAKACANACAVSTSARPWAAASAPTAIG